MIEYEEEWLCKLLFQTEGSVGKRACFFAIPAAVIAVICVWLDRNHSWLRTDSGLEDLSESQLWTALTAITMVLLAFRARQALSRFWEGTGLLHMMRGEWYDSVSCLITFSRLAKTAKPKEVLHFRHTLVRIMSLCHGSALQEIQDGEMEDTIETIDVGGLDAHTLHHLKECKEVYNFNRVEVLLHLTQTLVTQAHDDGVLRIPPPILSRVYQTLSRGFVNLLNAKKITDTRFPFPFAQLISILLFLTTVLSPMYITNLVSNYVFAPLVTFIVIFGMFSVNFAASELENPFGSDDNDLPLAHFQNEMNNSLLMLLHENTDHVPGIGPKFMRDFEHLTQSGSRISRIEVDFDDAELLEEVLAAEPAPPPKVADPTPPPAAPPVEPTPPPAAPAPVPEAQDPKAGVTASAEPKAQEEKKVAVASNGTASAGKDLEWEPTIPIIDVQALMLASMDKLNTTMDRWIQQVEDQALELNRNTGVLQHFTDRLPAFLDSVSPITGTAQAFLDSVSPMSSPNPSQSFRAAAQARLEAVNRGPYMFALPPGTTPRFPEVPDEDQRPDTPRVSVPSALRGGAHGGRVPTQEPAARGKDAAGRTNVSTSTSASSKTPPAKAGQGGADTSARKGPTAVALDEAPGTATAATDATKAAGAKAPAKVAAKAPSAQAAAAAL